MKDISIVIVTYNSEKDIANAINSVIENTKKLQYEIVVVDNSSQDKTWEIIKEFERNYDFIKIIQSENKGFNYANNIGIKNTTGKYIGLLNPDTILLNNVFDIIIDKMELMDDIGACGPLVLDGMEKPNLTHIFFPSIKDHFLRIIGIRKQNSALLLNPVNEVYSVDSPTGACFIFKRDLIHEIGLLDEKYFLYFDEADYAKRIKDSNYKNYIFPEAKLIHLQGQSTDSIKEQIISHNLKSYTRFVRKHYNNSEAQIIFFLFKIENYLKMVIFILLKNTRWKQYKQNNKFLNLYVEGNSNNEVED